MQPVKLKELDNYRKKLIEERRQGFKVQVKYFIETFNLYYLGLRTWFKLLFISNTPKTKKIDIVLLQHSEKVIKLNRKKNLKGKLTELGYSLSEVPYNKSTQVLKKGLIKKPQFKVNLKYLYHASYAEYLVSTYKPIGLLNDRNGMLLSPFLRDALNRNKGKLIHLAHATTVEDDWQFSMNDYDYYLLFGQSSYDKLRQRALLFGHSNAILSGSHMIDRTYNIEPLAFHNNRVLLLGMGPDREKTNLADTNYNIILEWVAKNLKQTLIVKPHPRSSSYFWQEAAKVHKNIELLNNSASLSEALETSGIVISIESNAVLEASLTKRPIIF